MVVADLIPRTLDDILGQPKAVAKIRRLIEGWRKGIPLTKALLLIGPVGTGKTSMAYVIANELGNSVVEEWNCALTENSANRAAEKLEFLPGLPKGWKEGDGSWEANARGNHILLLDEFDKYSKNERIALRRPIELAAPGRLIVITANKELEDDGLNSRTMRIDFVPLDDESSRQLAARTAKAWGLDLSEAALRWVARGAKGDARNVPDLVQHVDPHMPDEPVRVPVASGTSQREKARIGFERARAQGVLVGAPPKHTITDEQVRRATAMRNEQNLGWGEILRTLGLPKGAQSTLSRRVLKAGSERGSKSGSE